MSHPQNSHRGLFTKSRVDTEVVNLKATTRTGVVGDLYRKSDSLHFTPVSDDRTVMLSDGIITTSTTIANSTAETTIFTESVNANEYHAGEIVRCFISGHYSTTNATDTFDIKFKLGGTTLTTKTSVAENVTDGPWWTELLFTIRSTGQSGSVYPYVKSVFNNTHDDVTATSATTIDTTTQEDITATVKWDAADASNSVTVSQGYCEFIG